MATRPRPSLRQHLYWVCSPPGPPLGLREAGPHPRHRHRHLLASIPPGRAPHSVRRLPLQANFIVWGGIAGGIFFHEFTHVHEGPAKAASWFFYILGLGLVVLGLYLVRPKIYDEEVGAGAEEEGVAPRALPQVDASGSYNGARGGDHHKHKLPPASPMPLSSVLPNGSSLSSAPAPALATFSTN